MLRNICGRGAGRLAGPRRAASSFGRAGSVGQPDDGGNGWKKSRQILFNGLKVSKYSLSAIERAGSFFTRTGRVVVVGVIVVGVVKIMYEERIRSEETVDAALGYERARARVLNCLDAVGADSVQGPAGKFKPPLHSVQGPVGKFKPPVPSGKINEDWVWIEVVGKDYAAKDNEEEAVPFRKINEDWVWIEVVEKDYAAKDHEEEEEEEEAAKAEK